MYYGKSLQDKSRKNRDLGKSMTDRSPKNSKTNVDMLSSCRLTNPKLVHL